MRSDNGGVYTDFDIEMNQAGSKPVVNDSRDRGGRYRLQMDKTIRITSYNVCYTKLLRHAFEAIQRTAVSLTIEGLDPASCLCHLISGRKRSRSVV